MWSQHIVSLYVTDICLLEVLCFLEVDMNYLQTRLCELKKSFVVSILFTVSLIFQTSPWVARGICDSWRRLKFKFFYSSLFLPPGWAWRSPLWFDLGIHCDFAFFFLSVCGNAVPPLYFQPKPNLSKTLEGLLMRLVIFVTTIFQPNSLNITVSVCYMSGSKVNSEEKSRPYVCVFVFHLVKYINLGAFGFVVSLWCLESETGLGSLCASPWSRESQQPLP